MKPTETEADRHNVVTREIIAGILVECKDSDQSITETSQRIMALMSRRGYQLQIKYCNQLKNGKYI